MHCVQVLLRPRRACADLCLLAWRPVGYLPTTASATFPWQSSSLAFPKAIIIHICEGETISGCSTQAVPCAGSGVWVCLPLVDCCPIHTLPSVVGWCGACSGPLATPSSSAGILTGLSAQRPTGQTQGMGGGGGPTSHTQGTSHGCKLLTSELLADKHSVLVH